ncbi:MAG TPA: cyclic nucleotide-binding domain-containing protein [Thermoanaerobaculia bacterium]|nr:cyclic nucleotide-binding domain-containing protein [Thermoanaerobaculia bacterium]
MTETLRPILATIPLFDGMKSEHLEVIVGCAANVRLAPGEFAARQGEAADRFFIVRKGRFALQVHRPGQGEVTLLTVGDNEVLGWSWLVPPYKWHFDARALTETRALALDGRCLRGKFESDYELGYEMMTRFARLMTQRLEAANLQLLDRYGTPA